MNKKVFVVTIDQIKSNENEKNYIPINEPRCSPQISVDGKYIVNGSSWSVFCLNYEMIDPNTTKTLVKYLNQNSAPNNLKIGS